MTPNDSTNIPLDNDQQHRAAKIRAEIEAKRPWYHKLDYLQKSLLYIALIGLGIAVAKLWDFDSFNQRFTIPEAKPVIVPAPPLVKPLETTTVQVPAITAPVPVPVTPEDVQVFIKENAPPLQDEVFLVEEKATPVDRQLLTAHADARRDLEERVNELEQRLAIIVSTINRQGNATGGSGLTVAQVNKLAREQVEYYKRLEDKIAKRNGWRNYITWGDILKK